MLTSNFSYYFIFICIDILLQIIYILFETQRKLQTWQYAIFGENIVFKAFNIETEFFVKVILSGVFLC